MQILHVRKPFKFGRNIAPRIGLPSSFELDNIERKADEQDETIEYVKRVLNGKQDN